MVDLDRPVSVKNKYERAQRFIDVFCEKNSHTLNTTLVPYWIAGTDCFWYRRYDRNGVEFRLVDAVACSNCEAFDHVALAGALAEATQKKIESHNLPIKNVSISTSPVNIRFSAFDQEYLFDAMDNTCTRVDTGDAHKGNIPSENSAQAGWKYPTKPLSGENLISPDGFKSIFVNSNNLWVQDQKTGQKHQLTFDGEPLFHYAGTPITLGIAPNAEIHAVWSPDSTKILTVQIDNRQVRENTVFHYVPQDGSLSPFINKYRQAHPGDRHVEEQRIVVIDVDTGRQRDAHYRRVGVNHNAHGFFLSNLAWWSQNSRHAFFIDIDRDAKCVKVIEFDTESGNTRIVFEEVSETYISLSCFPHTPATLIQVPETNELIWYSERTGWAHLYLYDLTTGKLKRPITQGTWTVRYILRFDQDSRELWLQTAGRADGRDPYLTDICRVNIDTGVITSVTDTDDEYSIIAPGNLAHYALRYSDPDIGVNARGVSPSGRYFVCTRSRVDRNPVSQLMNNKGELLMELETADLAGLPEHWSFPEPVELLAEDGETPIYGAIFKPSDFSKEHHYPVIDIPGSTIKGAFHNNISSGFTYMLCAALAELGFIVVTIDGRGTPGREKSFADYHYGWFPGANCLEDRMAGIKQLASRTPSMDLSRVGVLDFSGLALLQYPEFYKVAVCPGVADARFMAAPLVGDRFEGTAPSHNGKHYPEQLVDRLQGKLLLIHHLTSTINPPTATLRLVDALRNANKDFDMLLFPNNGGGISHDRYAMRRIWDYFVMHLQDVSPPKEFSL